MCTLLHLLASFFFGGHLSYSLVFLVMMAGRRGEENLESKIIIRNYPADTSDRDLRIMFEKYGKIEDCKPPSPLSLLGLLNVCVCL